MASLQNIIDKKKELLTKLPVEQVREEINRILLASTSTTLQSYCKELHVNNSGKKEDKVARIAKSLFAQTNAENIPNHQNAKQPVVIDLTKPTEDVSRMLAVPLGRKNTASQKRYNFN